MALGKAHGKRTLYSDPSIKESKDHKEIKSPVSPLQAASSKLSLFDGSMISGLQVHKP